MFNRIQNTPPYTEHFKNVYILCSVLICISNQHPKEAIRIE